MVIVLSLADLAMVKYLTGKTYPYLAPVVREYLNEQLLEARYYWEFETWLDQMQATRTYFEVGPPVLGKRPPRSIRVKNSSQ